MVLFPPQSRGHTKLLLPLNLTRAVSHPHIWGQGSSREVNQIQVEMMEAHPMVTKAMMRIDLPPYQCCRGEGQQGYHYRIAQDHSVLPVVLTLASCAKGCCRAHPKLLTLPGEQQCHLSQWMKLLSNMRKQQWTGFATALTNQSEPLLNCYRRSRM